MNLPETFTDNKGVTKSSYSTYMRLKEWRYQLKPFNSHFQRRGGEVWPLLRIML
jgi:hypothetical protein